MAFAAPWIIDGWFTWSHSGVTNAFSICFAFLIIFILSWYYVSRSSPRFGKTRSQAEVSNTSEYSDGASVVKGAAASNGTESVANGSNASGKNLPPKAKLGLQILHECKEPNFDIVAVHGLGANPDYAWVWLPKNNPTGSHGYPDKPFNWLQELLPSKLPCRVLAFNYDSTWISNAPQQKLSNISDNLLHSLQDIRDKTPAVRRPLIFIGHSFGGNVIEQVIVSASRHHSEYLSIAESTIGVLFMGTPHRGSRAASWGALIATLAPPGIVTEDRLLRDLKALSDSQADRLRDFSHWLFSESVRVVCAFEQLVTDYSSRVGVVGKLLGARELVVPESSACIDGHRTISLRADHLKLNKFYGSDDPSFKLVYPQILKMAERAEERLNRRRNPRVIPTDERSTSGSLKTCLAKMRVRNPRDVLFFIQGQKGKREGNTCQWILNREEFSVWSASEKPQFLRLSGPPGIGKTMMSTFLVEVLQAKVEKSPGKIFAYFFCDDKDQGRKTPNTILRSIIWQLLLQRNELFRHVQADFEKHTDERVFEDLFSDFSALWRMFQDMVEDRQAGEVFILIDALDECDSLTRENLLRAIRNLFQPLPAARTGQLKILFTCRPDISDIENELADLGVLLRMDSTDINNDLSKYIDAKVDELARKKKYTRQIRNDVADTLKREAGGTFLWVSLMVAELGRREVLMHHVKKRLQNVPHGLDDTYAAILDRIPAEHRGPARFILHCMAAARRPLKKTEMQTAFAAWTTGSVQSGEDLAVYADILSVCSSILYVSSGDDETLSFCHQSVKDFLLHNPSTIDAWYKTTEDEANSVIFEACWVYLSADELKNGTLVVSREQGHQGGLLKAGRQLALQKQHLFLEYASDKWEDHAVASYSVLLRQGDRLAIDVTKAPTLRDYWLLRVALQGQEAVVRLLLEKGADITAKDEIGRTALTRAAELGHEAMVRLLLENGADIEAKDNIGQTALWWAAEMGHEAIVQLLLKEGADIEAKDNFGQTILSSATQHGHKVITRLLLENGADIEAKTNFGLTALSLAAMWGHEAVVRLLLESGADITAKDRPGRTALWWAAEMGHEAIVQLLLKEGADIAAKDKAGRTALSWVAEKGREAMVRLLLENGADITAKDNAGRTALWWAAEKEREAMVRLLLEKGADIKAKDNFG